MRVKDKLFRWGVYLHGISLMLITKAFAFGDDMNLDEVGEITQGGVRKIGGLAKLIFELLFLGVVIAPTILGAIIGYKKMEEAKQRQENGTVAFLLHFGLTVLIGYILLYVAFIILPHFGVNAKALVEQALSMG